MSTTMTIRLDDDLEHRLEVIAAATERSKSFLATEAIRAFVTTHEWQIGEMQAALHSRKPKPVTSPVTRTSLTWPRNGK
jgi:predicted transcriptional regulator